MRAVLVVILNIILGDARMSVWEYAPVKASPIVESSDLKVAQRPAEIDSGKYGNMIKTLRDRINKQVEGKAEPKPERPSGLERIKENINAKIEKVKSTVQDSVEKVKKNVVINKVTNTAIENMGTSSGAVKELVKNASAVKEKVMRRVTPPVSEEALVPSPETMEALKCVPQVSFSSCVQHCVSLTPTMIAYKGEDMKQDRHPLDITARLTGVQQSSVSGLPEEEARQLRVCIVSVCVHDYMTSNYIIGCLNRDGTVHTQGETQIPKTGLDKWAEFDFYDPTKLNMYNKMGYFRLTWLFKWFMPTCDLASGNCTHRTTTIVLGLYLVCLILIPLAIAYHVIPILMTMGSSQKSEPGKAGKKAGRALATSPAVQGFNLAEKISLVMKRATGLVAPLAQITSTWNYYTVPGEQDEIELRTGL